MTTLAGYHLLAEGRGIRREPGMLALFLDRAIEVTGLTCIRRFEDEKLGIAFAVIAESHISAHVDGDQAWVDIFSCRRFNAARAMTVIGAVFGGHWRHQRLWRGSYEAREHSQASALPSGGG